MYIGTWQSEADAQRMAVTLAATPAPTPAPAQVFSSAFSSIGLLVLVLAGIGILAGGLSGRR